MSSKQETDELRQIYDEAGDRGWRAWSSYASDHDLDPLDKDLMPAYMDGFGEGRALTELKSEIERLKAQQPTEELRKIHARLCEVAKLVGVDQPTDMSSVHLVALIENAVRGFQQSTPVLPKGAIYSNSYGGWFEPTGEIPRAAMGGEFVECGGYITQIFQGPTAQRYRIYRPWSAAGESGGETPLSARDALDRMASEMGQPPRRFIPNTDAEYLEFLVSWLKQIGNDREKFRNESDQLRQQLSAVQVKPGDVVLRLVGENIAPKQGQVCRNDGEWRLAGSDYWHTSLWANVYDVIEVPPVPPAGETASRYFVRQGYGSSAEVVDRTTGNIAAICGNEDFMERANNTAAEFNRQAREQPAPVPPATEGEGKRPITSDEAGEILAGLSHKAEAARANEVNRDAAEPSPVGTGEGEQFDRDDDCYHFNGAGTIYCNGEIIGSFDSEADGLKFTAFVTKAFEQRAKLAARTETLEGLLREARAFVSYSAPSMAEYSNFVADKVRNLCHRIDSALTEQKG